MKALEDMTVKEIKELKEQYQQDFIKVIGEFFENHPLVKRICLIEEYAPFNHDYVFLTCTDYNKVSSIALKNEPTL